MVSPSLSPFLPPSPLLPWSSSLSPENQSKEDGAQRGSAPSWLWPEAKSSHHTSTETHTHTPTPLPVIAHSFLSAYVNPTSPSFPTLTPSLYLYRIFHLLSLHNLVVQQCRIVWTKCVLYTVCSANENTTDAFTPTRSQKKKKDFPNQHQQFDCLIFSIRWTTAPTSGQPHVCMKCFTSINTFPISIQNTATL